MDQTHSFRPSGERPLVLLTGATGYIGGRLLHALEQRTDVRLRCMARRPEFLAPRASPGTEIVYGDAADQGSLGAALQGVRTAYYLVHSMGAAGSFEEKDRQAAGNFAAAARSAAVERIIYLGGLGNVEERLSPHLRSRQEVGAILREAGVPVIEFRASIVIGSGSLSFEMIRALVERLPVMLTPRWVHAPAQPIAIEDVVRYLVAALDVPLSGSRVIEIGGASIVSYGDIMRAYARERGKRLMMIAVPFLTPGLSSLWLGLVTPLYARIGRKLIESIVHATVVRDQSAREIFPDIVPMDTDAALRNALAEEDEQFARTRWSDALSSAGETRSWGGVRFGPRLVDSRTIEVPCSPREAFIPIERIGGDTGWYAWNRLWEIRGLLDLLAGGVGTRRGRPSPQELRVGDTVDFWRVEALERNRLLRLTAEMNLPGRAWLEFEVTGNETSSTIRQTALFDPIGWTGRIYWYMLFPFHQLIFRGMLRGIARAAVRTEVNPMAG